MAAQEKHIEFLDAVMEEVVLDAVPEDDKARHAPLISELHLLSLNCTSYLALHPLPLTALCILVSAFDIARIVSRCAQV